MKIIRIVFLLSSWIVISVLMLPLHSCKMHSFSKSGVVSDEVDKYFNPQEEISVWIYRDFRPQENAPVGLRRAAFYPADKQLLKELGLKGRDYRVLFSAVPENHPKDHFLAVKHRRRKIDLSSFEQVESEGKLYYQQDFNTRDHRVRHVFISYGEGNGLSLIQYTGRWNVQDGHFERLDRLARLNLKSFPQSEQMLTTWQVFECEVEDRIPYALQMDIETDKPTTIGFLRIYEEVEANSLLTCFSIVDDQKETVVPLYLCPGKYKVEYYAKTGEMVTSDYFEVHKD